MLAYVVSGIGFLGAGAIIKDGASIRGLNTAATLWCSAAVGAAAGAGLVAEATLLTVMVVAGNTLLRPLVNAINRIPLDERASEAIHEVRATATPEGAAAARKALLKALECARYPVGDVETVERGDDFVDIVATLVPASIVAAELDAVAERIGKHPGIEHAAWESNAAAA